MADIYINADSGDDGTGDGSSGSPYETLAHAFDQSSAGDTIICQDSTATYDFVDDTFDHNITIQGESDDASGAVFDGGGSEETHYFSADITYEKITFQNIHNLGSGDGYEPPVFQIHIDGDGITVNFTNCKLKNIAISMGDDVGGIVCFYNAYGTLNMTNVAMSNIYQASVSTSAPYLIGTRNPEGTCPINLTGVSFSTVDNSNTLAGIFSHQKQGPEIMIKNCIFRDANSNMAYGDTGDIDDISYSCFNGISSVPSGTSNITSDPLFVDEDIDDLRLRPGSPCIDTGTLI